MARKTYADKAEFLAEVADLEKAHPHGGSVQWSIVDGNGSRYGWIKVSTAGTEFKISATFAN